MAALPGLDLASFDREAYSSFEMGWMLWARVHKVSIDNDPSAFRNVAFAR